MAQEVGNHLIKQRAGRITHLNMIYGILFIGLLGTLTLILLFGSSASAAGKLGLTVTAISVAAYGILAIRATFEEIDAINKDVATMIPDTALGAHLPTIPVKLFSMLTAVLVLAMTVLYIWAIYG